MTYIEEYSASIDDPQGFWGAKAKELDWFKPASKVLTQDDQGIHHWFADAELNTSHLALDYHVDNGRAEQLALVYDSPVTDQQQKVHFS